MSTYMLGTLQVFYRDSFVFVLLQPPRGSLVIAHVKECVGVPTTYVTWPAHPTRQCGALSLLPSLWRSLTSPSPLALLLVFKTVL